MGANVEALARDYRAGHSLRVVGQMHSLSGQYVQRVLRQAGVPIRESGKRSPKVSSMIWSPEAIEKLRHLWAENLSTRAIGNELGCNKNSVIGKAHRLGLPARQNPSAFQGGRKRDRERAERRSIRPPRSSRAGTVDAKQLKSDEMSRRSRGQRRRGLLPSSAWSLCACRATDANSRSDILARLTFGSARPLRRWVARIAPSIMPSATCARPSQ